MTIHYLTVRAPAVLQIGRGARHVPSRVLQAGRAMTYALPSTCAVFVDEGEGFSLD